MFKFSVVFLCFCLALYQVRSQTSEFVDTLLGKLNYVKLVKDLHDPASAIHEVRYQNLTMEIFKEEISKVGHGHRYCAVQRDDWSCFGERYRSMLSKTEPFDNTKYNLNKLKRGTKIYADGNSFFGQMMLSIICENDPTVWKILDTTGNSFFIYYNESDVSVFLLCNSYVSLNPVETVKLLRSINFEPDLLILAANNYLGKLGNKNPETAILHFERVKIIQGEFLNASLISWLYTHEPDSCSALLCDEDFGHQCMSGPLLRSAERLADQILYEMSFHGRFR